MEISFKTSKLQKICNSEKETNRAWGDQIGAKVRARLTQMESAAALSDLFKLPQARCHQLKGARSGQFAVDLKHPFRLIFEPSGESIPKKADGGFDLTAITSVCIVEVVNYHD